MCTAPQFAGPVWQHFLSVKHHSGAFTQDQFDRLGWDRNPGWPQQRAFGGVRTHDDKPRMYAKYEV